jgi:hypothetical protein
MFSTIVGMIVRTDSPLCLCLFSLHSGRRKVVLFLSLEAYVDVVSG